MAIGEGGSGFHITFDNGNTVSVQWGYYNMCSKRNDLPLAADDPSVEEDMSTPSPNAEIAAWDSKGQWYSFGDDDVRGWVTPEDIVSFMGFVSSKDLHQDVWELMVPDKRLVTAIKLRTQNDIDGNPRRCWLMHSVPENGEYPRPLAVIKEGYKGVSALKEWLEKHDAFCHEVETIKVPVTEYNNFVSDSWTEICDSHLDAVFGDSS